MPELFQYPEIRGKKHKPRLWLWIVSFILIVSILIAIWATLSVFKTADLLMTRPAEKFNTLGTHLMPAFDEVDFLSKSDGLRLRGWYMSAGESARGSVVIVHQNRANRMLFGLESADFFRFLLDENFNVFVFDQRHSGQSEGDHSCFGFAEMRDVLSALETCRRISGNSNLLLYGIGSGVSASLLAWRELPTQAENAGELCRGDIKAMIFDTPAASAYDYIRAELNAEGFLNQKLYRPYLPPAVRMASGGAKSVNLIPIASMFPGPMMVIRNLPDTRLPAESIDSFINERLRLNPNTTHVSEIPLPGHLEAFKLDSERYLKELKDFLDHYFDTGEN